MCYCERFCNGLVQILFRRLQETLVFFIILQKHTLKTLGGRFALALGTTDGVGIGHGFVDVP